MTRAWKIAGLIIGACGLIAVGWIGARLWEYQEHAPLREGISALKAGDYSLALARVKPFAVAGDPLAQHTLGEMYAFGLGVPQDEVLAGMWFRRAECTCDNTGQFAYDAGLNYLEGYAGKRDTDVALNWIQHAAAAGHPNAQRLLAERTELAKKGVVVRPAVAEYWQRVLVDQRRK
jgi:uncharacterized protein